MAQMSHARECAAITLDEIICTIKKVISSLNNMNMNRLIRKFFHINRKNKNENFDFI